MEIVLQWLDELDDLVFAGLFKSTLLRTLCLAAALGTAIGTFAMPGSGIPSDAALASLNISLAFLIAWVFVGSMSARIARRGRSPSGNA